MDDLIGHLVDKQELDAAQFEAAAVRLWFFVVNT
jgi:hypothetical protein